MQRRSTNNLGYTHFAGDIVSNVDSSHAIQLTAQSTGGIIQPMGDDTSIALTIRAKNAGILALGNSTNAVDIAGSSVSLTSTHLNVASTRISFSSGAQMQIGSTAPFAGFIRFTSTAVSTPNFDSTNLMVIETSVTITGVNSSHFVLAQFQNNGIASTDMTIANVRTTSTANEVLIAFEKHSSVTVAASTATINFLVFRF